MIIKIDAHLEFRRESEAIWESQNPTLGNYEVAIVDRKDGTVDSKIGDGSTPYKQLDFVGNSLSELMNIFKSNGTVKNNVVHNESTTNCIQNGAAEAVINLLSTQSIVSNQGLNIEADETKIGCYDGDNITFKYGGGIEVVGDMRVPAPMHKKSVVNKAYVDGLFKDAPINNVPTKVSDLKDAGDYIKVKDGIVDISNNTLLTSNVIGIGNGLNFAVNQGNMEAHIDGDIKLECVSGTSINIGYDGNINVSGDMKVSDPVNPDSVVNKAYVDKLIMELREELYR
jgi:hypothetical protein